MPVSPELAAGLAQATVDLYTDAERLLLARIARTVSRGMGSPTWAEDKLLAVQEVRRYAVEVLAHLQQAATGTIGQAIAVAANRGSASAAADLHALTGGALEGYVDPLASLTGRAQADALLREVVTRVASTHLRILRTAEDTYRDVIARASGQVALGTQTRRDAAQRALDEFADRGVTGFVDRAGRNWDAASYVEMAVRTATAHAAVQAHADRLRAYGQDLVVVSDAPQECSLCLVPGTVVEGPVPTGRARLEYTGDVVSITTASGKHLTGTPDHAVLTTSGWRALKDLHPGDQVVSDDRQQRYAGVVPDDVQVPALIEEAGEARAPLLLAGPTRRDFDQNRAYREVCAVIPSGYLLPEVDASFGQPLADLSLVGTVGARSALSGLGDVLLDLGGYGSPRTGVGRFEHGAALLGAGFLPAPSHGGGALGCEDCRVHGGQTLLESMAARASGNAGTAQVLRDCPTADAEGGAELLRALSGHVAADEIVSVGWRQFRGHVWDLSTGPAWFLANGIVTHNCRPWEGKVLSLSGATLGTIDGSGGTRVTASLAQATAAGLHHPGCRHSISLYQPGLTRLPTATADPEGDADRQHLRYLERQVRASKRREAAALDDRAAQAARARVRRYQGAIREHVATSTAKRQPQREQVGRAR